LKFLTSLEKAEDLALRDGSMQATSSELWGGCPWGTLIHSALFLHAAFAYSVSSYAWSVPSLDWALILYFQSNLGRRALASLFCQ
jgi:hypothetical protein